MFGDHQSIVISINIFTQIDLIFANRITCVRCAKRLANYSNLFYEFRGLDHKKYTRYSILRQVCEPRNSSYILEFGYD
jgi:hypothetical protein